MKLFTPDVRLSSSEYCELIKKQKEANEIIAKQERLFEENRTRYLYKHGKALFITKDGLEAVGIDTQHLHPPIPIYQRSCYAPVRGIVSEDTASALDPIIIRTYSYTGEVRCGLPVYQEV